jgi:hypothetical protein
MALTCPVGTAQMRVAYNSGLADRGGARPYTFSIIGGAFLRQHFSHASKDGVQVMFQLIVHFMEARAGANK